MTEHRSLPESMLVDGKPYWQQLGGTAVSLLGGHADLAMGGYKRVLTAEGHCLINTFTSIADLKNRLPRLYEGALGIVVVNHQVSQFDYHGDDETINVPAILGELGEMSPALYVPNSSLDDEQRSSLLEHGYADVVDFSFYPSKMLEDVAKKVTLLARAAD